MSVTRDLDQGDGGRSSASSAGSSRQSERTKSKIGQLPAETIQNIARLLVEERGDSSTADLASLVVVCKSFNQVLTPVLYERVEIISFEHPLPVDAASYIEWDDEMNIQAAEAFSRVHLFCKSISEMDQKGRKDCSGMVKTMHLDLMGSTGLWGRDSQNIVSTLPLFKNLEKLVLQIKSSDAQALTAAFQYIANQTRARPQILKRVNILLLDNLQDESSPTNASYHLCHIQMNSTIDMALHPYLTRRPWRYETLDLLFCRFILVCLAHNHSPPLNLYMQDDGPSDWSFCNSVKTLRLHNLRSETMVADFKTIPRDIEELGLFGETTNLLPSEVCEALQDSQWLPLLKRLDIDCLTHDWKVQEDVSWTGLLTTLEQACQRRGIELSLHWRCGQEGQNAELQ